MFWEGGGGGGGGGGGELGLSWAAHLALVAEHLVHLDAGATAHREDVDETAAEGAAQYLKMTTWRWSWWLVVAVAFVVGGSGSGVGGSRRWWSWWLVVVVVVGGGGVWGERWVVAMACTRVRWVERARTPRPTLWTNCSRSVARMTAVRNRLQTTATASVYRDPEPDRR